VSDDTRLRAGALRRIAVAQEGGGGHYGQVYSAAREAELLSWAATVPDEDILGWRNTGHGYLRWIRDHQPHWHRNLWPEMLALVEGVLKWHHKGEWRIDGSSWCSACPNLWPCPDRQAAEAVIAKAEAERAEP